MKKLVLFASFIILFIKAAFALVNINSASYEELLTIKGVGPKKAQAIIEYRNTHGKFHNVDELNQIKGFSDKSVSKITPQIEIK